MRLGVLARKDARLLARNRPLLVALLLYPFLLATVLGVAFQEPPSTLDLVVVDDDRDAGPIAVAGTNLTTANLLNPAASFARIERVATEEEALAVLRQGDADAFLHIPRGFLVNLSSFVTNATLYIVVDESDPIRAGVSRNAVQGAVESFVELIVQKKLDDISAIIQDVTEGGVLPVFNVEVMGLAIARQKLESVDPRAENPEIQDVIEFIGQAELALGQAPGILKTTAIPLRVEERGLAGARTSLAAVAVPGALVLGVFWTGALAAALLTARERESGVHRRLAASPAPGWLQAISKALMALTAALLPAAVLVLLAMAAFGLRPADLGLAALVLVAASLAAAALGALCAAITRATAGAALLAVLLLVPMLLLGGLFYPVAYMPAPAQALANVLPITLATDALRGALLRGSTLSELGPTLAGLGAFVVVATGIGAWVSRRT